MYSLFFFFKKSPLLFTQGSRQFAWYTCNSVYHSARLQSYAIYSLDFIINGLVISRLFHHLIALSLDPFERHCTIVNRILNSDSGLIVIPHFVPGLCIAPSPFFSHHRGSKAFIKYGGGEAFFVGMGVVVVWGFF